MVRTLEIACFIGSREVLDHGVNVGPLLASEFLLIASLFEGTGAASTVLSVVTNGPIDLSDLASTCGVSLVTLKETFRSQRAGLVEVNLTTSKAVASSVGPTIGHSTYLDGFEHLERLPASDFVGPTEGSNWIIPGHLLIAQKPWDNAVEVQDLLDGSHLTVIVCLLDDYRCIEDLVTGDYPRHVPATTPACHLVWYPIEDFSVPQSIEGFGVFVRDLATRIIRGDVVLVHCRGGKGRTGLVVIPLLACLYHVPIHKAREMVVRRTREGRRSLRGHPPAMPEDPSQIQVLDRVLEVARITDHPRR
jgi:hypothetical protein